MKIREPFDMFYDSIYLRKRRSTEHDNHHKFTIDSWPVGYWKYILSFCHLDQADNKQIHLYKKQAILCVFILELMSCNSPANWDLCDLLWYRYSQLSARSSHLSVQSTKWPKSCVDISLYLGYSHHSILFIAAVVLVVFFLCPVFPFSFFFSFYFGSLFWIRFMTFVHYLIGSIMGNRFWLVTI